MIIRVYQVIRLMDERSDAAAESYRTREAAERAEPGWWGARNRIAERDALLLDDGRIRLLGASEQLHG